MSLIQTHIKSFGKAFEKLKKVKSQLLAWKSFNETYRKRVKSKFQEYEVELVVYDEVEYFYDHDHRSFNYPYVNRKEFLSFWKFDPFLPKTAGTYADYVYPRNTLQFQKSVVCLEESYMD